MERKQNEWTETDSRGTSNPASRFQDQVLICKICGESFIWSAGEQEFYSDRKLSQPLRCKADRWKKPK